ncbi:MAG: TniQ family protein [Rhodopseudomonas palustris]|uniref:TniQ family protein n=1 Tax=Rhodopseudomonas palustris TaxID=1076 RepID=A0A933W2E6_RHOPL|nr:TniQ family protein [Rhodopseudomonas palustris]
MMLDSPPDAALDTRSSIRQVRASLSKLEEPNGPSWLDFTCFTTNASAPSTRAADRTQANPSPSPSSRQSGIDPAALAAHAFVHLDKHRYVHRGQELVRSGLRRSAVAVCPCCLANDIARTRPAAP